MKLHTMRPSKWYEKLNVTEIPAGTECTLIDAAEVPDQREGAALKESVKRLRQRGEEHVIVMLAGKARLFPKRDLKPIEQ